ncbi:hypothetical protein [Anoxynatronum sibiricum]|uniref:Uncharacterized protein n=1 Tax=Anoxynatronum sibiricum TaxID=210623 RepID=A0ABU9VZE3_9CLOT
MSRIDQMTSPRNIHIEGTPPSFDMLMNRYQPMITGFLCSRTVSTQLAELGTGWPI